MAHAVESIQAKFLKGAAEKGQFPESNVPEVAMIGRSNVGKSSLINSILRSGTHARVSNTPGKTQEINFFATNLGIVFVDLPGYGYAKVSKERRQEFSRLIRDYLFGRDNLALVCVLIDARHDPQPLDMAMLEELENHGRPFCAILTKSDKLKPAERIARVHQVRGLLAECQHAVDVVLTSAEDGTGRNEVIGIIKRLRTSERTSP